MLIHLALTTWVVFGARLGPRWAGTEALHTFGIVPTHFRLHSLVTYAFFHESYGHLLVNLFYLWVFGAGVEEAVGRVKYLLWYVAGGAFGGAMQLLVTRQMAELNAGLPIVGASAACAGLVGLFAVRYYRARLSFVGLPYRPHVVSVVSLFLAYEVGAGLWNLVTGSAAGGVAHWSHVGGFIFGLTCAQLFRLDTEGQSAYLRSDATQAMERSDPGEAIKHWEALLQREPGNPAAHCELARAWLLLGDKEQSGHHAAQAIELYLLQNQRTEGARVYAELRTQGVRLSELGTTRLFALGNTLEELEQFVLAAEALRAATTRHPDSPAAETALLKVITLYAQRLGRREEAQILARLFLERYPHSPWRSLAEDLYRSTKP